MNKVILQFQKDCFANYLDDIREFIPDPYVYPDGNPIRPVLPVKTTQNAIMIIGAFPSARFERRNGMLIPVGDNLSPFGYEEYFDGAEVRTQASRDSLNENYFKKLNINVENIWLTDIVKVYLYPEKHLRNCEIINPNYKFINTHKLFKNIAKASKEWIFKEINICNPKLIITLGEIPARVISGDENVNSHELLNGEVRIINLEKEYKIAHLGHPEIIRMNNKWKEHTEKALERLSVSINKL